MMQTAETMPEVRVSSLIAPPFRDPWRKGRGGACDELWLSGGRGSGKSSFISLLIVCGMLADPKANAIIYRKVGETLRESVYSQMVWAIEMLGVSVWFQCRLSPLEIVYIFTGQRILFRGADKPEKSKGVKLQRGYFKYLWFEELTEFNGMPDVRTIKASILRGSSKHALTLYSYNPPMSALSWVKRGSPEAAQGPPLPPEQLSRDAAGVAGRELPAGSRGAETVQRARVPAYVPGGDHRYGRAGV